jgi:outer membrane protein assembly factor BamB
MIKNYGVDSKISIKQVLSAIALILMLTVSAFIVTTPVVNAKMATVAKISVTPGTVGLGQYVLVTGWVTPQPQVTGSIYHDFVITITKPDGTTYTKMMDSDTPGTFWFTYTPEQIGTYSAKLTWAGDADMQGSESVSYPFSVNQTQVPLFPDTPLPSGYWQRPITDVNRDWYVLGGAWMETGRNERDVMGSCFNPYSTAPSSSHILWVLNTGMGGLSGGEYGATNIATAPAKVIMLGRAYYMSGGIHCVDLSTGQELWNPPIAASGSIFALPGGSAPSNTGSAATATPSIWITSGASMIQYNAYTGAMMKNVTGIGASSRIARTVMDERGIFYISLYDVNSNFLSLTKWDSTKATAAGGWASGIIWEAKNETLNIPPQALSNLLVWQAGGIIFMSPNGGNYNAAFNDTTGELMWNIQRTDILGFEGAGGVADGIGFAPGSNDMKIHGYNMTTGEEVWQSEPATYPWGSFCAYQAGIAYGMYYYGSYDGYIRALNVTNGQTIWKFYSGDSGYETPYGTWAFYGTPAIADGKVYMATTEHSPTDPVTRGNRLYCFDAFTGDLMWSIMGCQGQSAIADGVLVSSDGYSSNMFAFAKGETATTVSAPDTVIPMGTPVLVKGTVVDLSPAQPNTPAISDADMTAWMEYLHMQQPLPDGTSTYKFYPAGTPTDFTGTGVSVKLTAIDSNGHSIDLGTATSDASGLYSLMWTPPAEGKYTIVANFEGSNSYYASYAETVVGVSAASSSSSSSASPTTTASSSAASPGLSESPSSSAAVSPSTVESQAPASTGTSSTTIYIAVAAVVVIVAVVVAALVLRKRSK